MADRRHDVTAGGEPTLPEIAALQARLQPNAIAIEAGGRRTTYRELHEGASGVARALIAAGLRPADRVCTLMINTERVFEVVLGTVMARGCVAPLSFRLAAREIAQVIDDASPAVLFVSPELEDLAQAAMTHAASRPRLIQVGVQGEDELAALVGAAPAQSALPDWQSDDDVIQLYTSGTTGLPKGVRHTNGNYQSMLSLRRAVHGFAYGRHDVILDVMPLFHIAGLNSGLMTFAGGGRLVIVPEFSPAAVLAAVSEHRVTKTLLAPVMIKLLLDAPEIEAADLSSLRLIVYGASPISEDVLSRARERFGCGFMQLYGMTELAGPATVLEPLDHDVPGRLRSCGRAWPGMAVKVVDARGRRLPPGEIGEIAVKGPVLMGGYYRRPDATTEAIQEGWLRTGDAGYFDDAGFLFIHDRVKDMIVSGAENIYPAEVENALADCPGIADVAVVGTPSETWGEQVTALVVPAPGATLDPDAVRAWARDRIAGFKVPKRVEVVDAIPRNASGKILRREVRSPFWADRERAIG